VECGCSTKSYLYLLFLKIVLPKNPHGLWGTEYARLAKITRMIDH
jgi:hypothetical protein